MHLRTYTVSLCGNASDASDASCRKWDVEYGCLFSALYAFLITIVCSLLTVT